MFNHVRNHIESLIKKLYLESEVHKLFKVLPTTHDKIILALVQQSMKYDLLSFGRLQQSAEISAKNQRSDVLAFVLNLGVFTFSIFKYSFVPLLYRLIVGKYSRDINDKNDLRFVFINSAGGMDRLASMVQDDFSKNQYIMLYLFTSFPGKIFERLKKKPNINFISPQFPLKKAVYRCLVFLFRNGHHFTLRLLRSFSHYPLVLRLKIVTANTQYIYALLMYHPWAEDNAFKMAKAYPNALFIFDLDEAGKELLLADSLNRLKKKTLLIQHGALTNAKRYIPTCASMACTSERERQALISEGVDSEKLFVTGQALQTIKDSTLYKQTIKPSYPILILAGAGPTWLQGLYIDMLKRSDYLKKFQHIYMRIHPAMDSKRKKIWFFDRNIKPTGVDESLVECISKCQIVITFSIDALMVAVRQQHPSVVCIPKSFYVPAWHNFLEDLTMVKVAQTSSMIDAILADKNFWNCCKHDFSESQWKNVDYAFGELNTKTNLTNLMHKLAADLKK